MDPAEVEKARKEAEQARMYANQLENKLKAKETEEAAAKAKQLEEKEEFKTLYETLKSQIDERDAKDAEKARREQLTTATEDVFKDYSADAIELAKTAGLTLTDDTDEARTALKEKLDAFQKKVGTSAPAPRGSNPRQDAPQVVDRSSLTAADSNGVSPMALASAKGDDSVTRQYISTLPAVQRMKEIAKGGM
jgi:hypothetical protein